MANITGEDVTDEFQIKLSGTTLSAGDSGAITVSMVAGYPKKIKLTLSGNTVDTEFKRLIRKQYDKVKSVADEGFW